MTNLDIANKYQELEVELDKLLSGIKSDSSSSESKRTQMQNEVGSLGIQLLVLSKSEILFSKVYGNTQTLAESGNYELAELKDKAVFDLGSLTRIIASSSILYLLVQEGLLTYEHRISRYLPSFGTLGKERMTVGHFISHTSGLPSSINLLRSVMQTSPRETSAVSRRVAQDKLLKELLKVRIVNLPGRVSEASQLGYIILLYVIEQITGLTIDKVYRKLIAKPLGLKSLDYIDWELLRREKIEPDLSVIVPSKVCSWRNKMIHGECSDEIAWYLSGVSTHSGLFGNLGDVAKIGQAFCEGYKGTSALFAGGEFSKKFEEFLYDKPSNKGQIYNLLGLVKESIPSTSESEFIWYGLDGDTGVSLWIEPVNEIVMVLGTTQLQKSKDLNPQVDLSRKVRTLISELS